MGMMNSTIDRAAKQTRGVMVWVGVWGALVACGCSGERLVVGDEEEAIGSSGSAGKGNAGQAGSGAGGSDSSGGSGSGGSTAGASGDIECPCTRRVPNAGWGCYVGSGKQAELPIASKGGTLVLDGTESTRGVSVELGFPLDALEERTVVSITELTEPPPDAYIDYSPMYLLEPTSAVLNAPVTVRVPWSSSLGTVDPSLAIYRGPTPEGPFEIADDNYINAGFNQGRLTEFGYFFVGYPKSEEQAACP